MNLWGNHLLCIVPSVSYAVRSGQPDSRGPEDPIGRTWKGLHRHIIISQKLKTKRNFAAAREKWHIICKSTAIRLWEDFSTETLQTKRV